MFVFRSADHCESCPLSPAPSPPALPGPPCPAKESALAGAPCCLSPGGHALCPRGGQAAHPRVPSGAGGATCPQQGRARPLCPSLGVPLPGDTQRWGVAGAPRGAGGDAEALRRRCCPPSQSTGCQGGGQRGCSALAPHRPHCTPQSQPGEVPRGWRGPEQGDSCDTPGCHTRLPRCSRQCRGSLGSLGDPHSPGAPRSEPPHQTGPGEPPRHGHPGGTGEGARR